MKPHPSIIHANDPPADLHLTADVQITAAAGDATKPAQIEIVAYTGDPIKPPYWPLMIVDLKGLSLPPSIPLLADHREGLESVVGSGRPSVENGKLVIRGVLAQNASDTAAKIIALHRDGVNLQASIGASPSSRRMIRAGEKVTVNGREHTAPAEGLLLIEKATLRETSIVAVAADSNSTVSIAATGNAGGSTNPPSTPEAQRIAEIQTLRASLPSAASHGLLFDEAIIAGTSVADLKATLLSTMRAARPAAPTIHVSSSGTDPAATLQAGLLMRAGRADLAEKTLGQPAVLAAQSQHLHAATMLDVCRFAVAATGDAVPPGPAEAIIRAAFSSGSLPIALGTSIEKIALDVFMELTAGWRNFARIVSANNFREHRAVRLASGGQLEQVGPTGELHHGTIGEESHPFKVDTYGRLFMLTRTDVVNDDLQILSDLPQVLAAEGARLLNDLVYSQIALGESAGFFSVGNKNLVDNEDMDPVGLSKAIIALRTQKDQDGRLIGMQPRSLVVPAALETAARQLLNSAELSRDATSDNAPTANPFAGMNLELVVEPRLDDAADDEWYLLGPPRAGAVLVSFLNGAERVTVEQVEPPADRLGIGWRAYLDAGAALAEHRAAVKVKA